MSSATCGLCGAPVPVEAVERGQFCSHKHATAEEALAHSRAFWHAENERRAAQ